MRKSYFSQIIHFACNKIAPSEKTSNTKQELLMPKVIERHLNKEKDSLIANKIKEIFQDSEAKTNSGYSRRVFEIKEKNTVTFNGSDRLLEVTIQFTDNKAEQIVYIKTSKNIFSDKSRVMLEEVDPAGGGNDGGDVGWYCMQTNGGCCCKLAGNSSGISYVCACTCSPSQSGASCQAVLQESKARM